jgi:hypothetical protein
MSSSFKVSFSRKERKKKKSRRDRLLRILCFLGLHDDFKHGSPGSIYDVNKRECNRCGNIRISISKHNERNEGIKKRVYFPNYHVTRIEEE